MDLTETQQATLLASKLFAGVQRQDLPALLEDLRAHLAVFPAGGVMVARGEQVREVGVVLAGQGRSLIVDGAGGELIVSLLEAGSFLGVLLAASRTRKSPVTVQATEETTVLFLPARELTRSPLLENFLDSVAEQSLSLNDRIDCLIRRSVREKVSTYLLRTAARQQSREIVLPLDREAMANYLNVERSALSRELSRMKADGLIDYRKNVFRLLELH